MGECYPLESCEPADSAEMKTPALQKERWCPADGLGWERRRRPCSAPRHRLRQQRRRLLRIANDKLAAIEENERCLRWERDLRQATLLHNMAARLEAEVRACRRPRAGRPHPRPAADRLLLDADVRDMFSDICEQQPVLIGPLDEDDDVPRRRDEPDEPDEPAQKRRRLSRENADPNVPEPRAPREQVRLAEGCAAAAGIDFQHVFHQLVPSLES